MNQAGANRNGSGSRGGRALVALALVALPWVAGAMTTDHSTTMRVGATVFSSNLSHTPYAQPLRADYPVSLSLSVESPDDPIRAATLLYRRIGEPDFRRVPLQPPPDGRPGSYRGTAQIPSDLSVAQGTTSYEYYFEVLAGTDVDPLSIAWRPSGAQTALLSTVVSSTKTLAGAGGTVALAQGSSSFGDSKVVVPSGALTGSSSVSLSLMVSGSASAAMGTPVGGRLPVTGLALQLKPNAVFQRPASFYMAYKDLDNDGRVDGGGADETLLQPAWFDGLNWRALPRMGIDAAKNVVSFATSLTGYFALIPTSAAPSTYRPQEKIFSPNGDGVNDAAFFDGLPAGARIVILDVRGRVVREISDINVWDGRDTNGEPVESGMYLYQVHSDQGLFSGTLTVAR